MNFVVVILLFLCLSGQLDVILQVSIDLVVAHCLVIKKLFSLVPSTCMYEPG